MKRHLLRLLSSLMAAALLAGCGITAGETSEEVSELSSLAASSLPPSIPSEESSEPEPPAVSAVRNPLTGEPGYDEALLGRRPVAVMVNNIAAALPQRGLAAADLVYEVVTEGGITRLMAVYADPASIPYVGPVRSVRHYYVALALPYDPVFVHFGGSPAGYNYISNLNVDNIDGMSYTNAFYQDSWRASNRGREHSFFIDADGIASVAGSRNYDFAGEPAPLFQYGGPDSVVLDQADASEVFVPFSTSYSAGFFYDAETGLYRKQRNGADHIDADSNEVLTFKNVLILYTSVTAYQGEAQRREVALGGGDGWYVTGGGRQPISWSKGDSQDQITITGPDGKEIEANPGKCYICITDKGNAASTTFK